MHATFLRMLPVVLLGCTLAACQVSNSGAPSEKNESSAAAVGPVDNALASGPDANAQCKLDVISGKPAAPDAAVKHGEGAAFEGWGFIKGQPAFHAATLVFHGSNGSFGVPVNTGIARDDVAQGFGDKALGSSGFSVTADISRLPSSTYALSLRTDAPDAISVCDLHAQVKVSD